MPSHSLIESDEELFVKPEYRRVFPPKSEVEDGLRTLLERGVSLYFFFTGGLDEYNYARQHEDTFPGLDLGRRAWILHLPDCAHTITGLEHQSALISDLRGWMQSLPSTVRALA